MALYHSDMVKYGIYSWAVLRDVKIFSENATV